MGKKSAAFKNSKKQEGDFLIVILVAILSIFGLIMVFSASLYVSLSKFGNTYSYLLEDVKWMVLGWAALIFLSNFDYRFIRPFANLLLLIGVILLLLIFTPLGVTINNATRWLDFKLFTVMPGEIIKFCLIVYLARFYADKPDRIRVKLRLEKTVNGRAIVGFETILPLIWVVALLGGCFILIYKQPNLSTAGIVVLLGAGMMFIAGLHWLFVATMGGGLAGLLLLIFNSPKFEYQKARMTGFLDPFQDALGDGYQVVQGLLAMGSGGVLGVGLGQSVQKTLYLPEPMNDFILPIIGEELGFVGIICLLCVYMVLIWRISRTALRCKDYFGMLIASGVALHLALQVALNVAVVSASFPPTGVVLPFITLGGNATVIFLAEMGIVINISKHCDKSI